MVKQVNSRVNRLYYQILKILKKTDLHNFRDLAYKDLVLFVR